MSNVSLSLVLFLLPINYFLQVSAETQPNISSEETQTNSSFVQLYDSTCVGCTLTFECTVFGAGLTLWQGSALGCEIELRHSDYMNAEARGSCRNGSQTVVARSVGVSGINYYTSILNITVRQEIVNGSVECNHLNIHGQIIEIGQGHVTQAPYAPPRGVHVALVDMDLVVFSWSEVEAQCPYIQYIISAVNCGLCPNSTVDTTVTCTNISESVQSNNTCMFAIQTETCGSVLGEISTINVTLYYDNVSHLVSLSITELESVLTTIFSGSQTKSYNHVIAIMTVITTCFVMVIILLLLVSIRLLYKQRLARNIRYSSSSGSGENTATLKKVNEEHHAVVSTGQEDNNAVYSLLQACQDADDSTDKGGVVLVKDEDEPLYAEIVSMQH